MGDMENWRMDLVSGWRNMMRAEQKKIVITN